MPRVAFIVLAIIFGMTGFFTLASEHTHQNISEAVYNTPESAGLYEKLVDRQENGAEAVFKKSYIVTTSQNSEAEQKLQSHHYIRFFDTSWF